MRRHDKTFFGKFYKILQLSLFYVKRKATEKYRKDSDLAFRELSRQDFLELNMPYAISQAGRYKSDFYTGEDLVIEAFIGMNDAYDSSRKGVFITFATSYIKRSLNHAMLGEDDIKKPSNYYFFLKKLNKTAGQLEKNLGRQPTLDEIAEKMNWGKEIVMAYFAAEHGETTLSKPIFDDASRKTLLDRFKNSSNTADSALSTVVSEEIHKVLKKYLNKNEQFVLGLKYGLAPSCRDFNYPVGQYETKAIAKALNISVTRVNQIKDEAFKKLREKANGKLSCLLE